MENKITDIQPWMQIPFRELDEHAREVGPVNEGHRQAQGQGALPIGVVDETDDPLSRHVETLAYETQRLGLQGRVVGSHLTSMHSMDNYYVSKLLPLMHEAQLGVVANPLINITLFIK